MQVTRLINSNIAPQVAGYAVAARRQRVQQLVATSHSQVKKPTRDKANVKDVTSDRP